MSRPEVYRSWNDSDRDYVPDCDLQNFDRRAFLSSLHLENLREFVFELERSPEFLIIDDGSMIDDSLIVPGHITNWMKL